MPSVHVTFAPGLVVEVATFFEAGSAAGVDFFAVDSAAFDDFFDVDAALPSTPPWPEQAPEPVTVLVVPSLHLTFLAA